MTRPTVCGADGCPAGWLAVTLPPGAPCKAVAQIRPKASDLVSLADVIAIDIPIGLRDRPEAGPRPTDRAARAFLTAKNQDGVRGVGSRVFAAPTRAHLEVWHAGGDYAALRRAFPPPRALSKQCWNICAKIAEVDTLLATTPRAPIWEAHPEVSFAQATGRTLPPKKRLEGRAARTTFLTAQGFDLPRLVQSLPRGRSQWNLDDLLDACMLALTAERIDAGRAVTLPDPPQTDSAGRRMAIHL